jgi:hypothetical protein
MYQRKIDYLKKAEILLGLNKFNIVEITVKDVGSYHYKKVMQLLRDNLHHFELVPESDFENFLNRNENGTMSNNAYYLTVIKAPKKIIGIASYFYLGIPNIIFMGYLVIRKDFRGKELSYLLIENTISRCRAKAFYEHKKVPRAIIGEVPRVELENDILERNIVLSRTGLKMITGIDYVQPPGIPFNLCMLPLNDDFKLSIDFVKEVVYNIHTIVYSCEDYLKQILKSININKLNLVPL